MRGAQEVDVGLFHQADILLIGGIIDIAACAGMMVVAVHAAQLHVLTVDLEHLADTLHTLHAEVVVEVLIVFTIFHAKQFHGVRIEPGFLGRPKARGTIVVETEFDSCCIACTKLGDTIVGDISMAWIAVDTI